MNRGDSFVSTDDQAPTNQPSLKTVKDLALQGADSLEAVARRADSIFWEKVEETIHGEVTVFDVDGDGSFQESVAGVAFAPYPRFYAGLSDVFYHPYCNILTHNDEIVYEDTIAETGRSFDAWPLNHLQLGQVRQQDERECLPKIWGPTLIGGHSSMGIFGHFLLDTLPVIIRYREMLNSGEVKIAFFTLTDWIQSFLKLANVDTNSIISLDIQPTWFSHSIISHHHSAKTTQYPCANVDISFEILRERISGDGSFEKVFFLRGNAAKRLRNEPEVAALFASRGFVILDPQKFSVEKQAQIVKNATVFASVFGSGFSLCPLMAAGGSVIELSPGNIVDHWLRRLVARFHLRHFNIIYDGETLAIDVAALAKALDRILG